MTVPNFSDELFSGLEPLLADHRQQIAEGDVVSQAEAARILDESRQHTSRRVAAKQLREIRVGRSSFVRRAEVLALLDAGKPPPGRGARVAFPTLQAEIAAGRARTTSEDAQEQLRRLQVTVDEIQREVRSIRMLLRDTWDT
jgi:hypothetical protein